MTQVKNGWALMGLLLVGLGGCAKFPATDAGTVTTRLTFKMRMDGPIRTGTESGAGGVPYVYIVALRLSQDDNPTTEGPIPGIAPPWGNGFVAGNATHYIAWDPTASSEFTIYRFINPELQQWAATGIPVTFRPVTPGDNQIEFEVDLAQLEPNPDEAAKVRSIQVNFLTMDSVPQTGSSKEWDALGDRRLPSEINTFLTATVRANGLFNNQRAGEIEPRLDQSDPALDLVDWSLEVRLRN